MAKKDNLEDKNNNTYNRSKEEKYWLNKFSGELTKSYFPYDFKIEKKTDPQIEIETLVIGGEVYERLVKLSNNSDFRLYMILLAGMNILIEKYTSNNDIIIGTTVLKQDIDGDFVNTILALRNKINLELTFKEFLLKVREDFIKDIENQNYSIDSLLYKLDLSTNEKEFPLFSNALLLSNIHEEKYLKDIILNTKLIFSNRGNELYGEFSYNSSLYERSTIKRIIGHFNRLLEQVIFNLDVKISEVDLLSDNEKSKVLNDFSGTLNCNIPDKTIIELFNEQVSKNPERIACEYGDLKITFSELNKRTNQLANILSEKGIKSESIVAILLDRSIDMLVSILGTIKAGGAYLTIDKNYPEKRIEFILNDSDAKILITENQYLTGSVNKDTLLFEDLEFQNKFKENGNNDNKPESLLYIIYTSGSTGKPKGVLIENKGCVNMVQSHKRIFKNDHNSRMSQVSSCSFDAMSFEIWPCLTSGGNLCIANDEIQKDPFKMKKWLIKNHVNISYQPTYMVEKLLEDEWSGKRSSLKAIRAAGDCFRRNPLREYPFKIYNLYGPTEDTVWTTFAELLPTSHPSKTPVIGKPIENKKVYILNNNGRLQPIGIEGELCISGVGLARKYLNDIELTNQRFIPNNFEINERLYKTGDIAKWLPDGNIEFVNRKDQQVKIRGFRIELREVELCLINHPKIDDAIVIERTHLNEDKYLCTYYVSLEELSFHEIKEHLSKSLPDYMIPIYFVKIDSIPFTESGKVNRRALPEPEILASEDYIAPRDETERILVDIYQKVLNVERIGINDNFFMIGGDSIKAIQISSNAQELGLKLEIKDMFVHPRISELKDIVTKIDRIIPQDTIEGEVLFTPVTYWYFNNFLTDINHFNQSVMFFTKDKINIPALKKTFDTIVKHHDALRMIFPKQNNKTIQYNRPVLEPFYDLYTFDFTDKKDHVELIEKECDMIQKSIDLENGPLVKVGLFNVKEGDHVLITIHHSVIDSVSWRIIIEDFTTAYELALQNKEIKLKHKTDSFKYWSERLNDYANSNELLEELDYWKKIDETNTRELVSDFKIEKIDNKRKNTSVEYLKINKEYTDKLLYKVNKAYNTEINDILLTALALAIKKWQKINKVLISLEGHGREDILKEVNVSRTVGWFTSQYPVVLDVENSDLSYNIKFIKETLRKIPNKGIGYGILQYLTSKDREVSFNNQPQINFNYLGEFSKELTKEDITISKIDSGKKISDECERNGLLEINSILMNGVFTFSMEFNGLEFKKETIKRLSKEFEKSLIEIIDHCCNKDKIEITPNDVGYNDLSIEELGQIENLINKI
ncbi:MAG: amino acid adenylation domain-containing protein [Bacteroidales bacterium]|nr:amino acid adenylation domain-containing protein [Bacteroidales bacterium]